MWSRNVRQLLAPSTLAASNGSCGIDCRPASRIRNISGVHSQTSSATIAQKALVSWTAARSPAAQVVRDDRQEADVRRVHKPEHESDDHRRHDHRDDQDERTARMNGSSRTHSSARPRPSTVSNRTAKKTYLIVVQTAARKTCRATPRGSCRARSTAGAGRTGRTRSRSGSRGSAGTRSPPARAAVQARGRGRAGPSRALPPTRSIGRGRSAATSAMGLVVPQRLELGLDVLRRLVELGGAVGALTSASFSPVPMISSASDQSGVRGRGVQPESSCASAIGSSRCWLTACWSSKPARFTGRSPERASSIWIRSARTTCRT